MSYKSQLVLASSSPARLKLLQDAMINPNKIVSPHIDENQFKNEKPKDYCQRMAKSKLEASLKLIGLPKVIVIAADTITVVGGKILHKTQNLTLIKEYIQKLSGRRHGTYTSVACALLENGQIIKTKQKIVKSIVQFKRMTDAEIEHFVKSRQGINKAGGCQISGIIGRYLKFISGSYSNVVGLPIYETTCILNSLGYELLN